MTPTLRLPRSSRLLRTRPCRWPLRSMSRRRATEGSRHRRSEGNSRSKPPRARPTRATRRGDRPVVADRLWTIVEPSSPGPRHAVIDYGEIRGPVPVEVSHRDHLDAARPSERRRSDDEGPVPLVDQNIRRSTVGEERVGLAVPVHIQLAAHRSREPISPAHLDICPSRGECLAGDTQEGDELVARRRDSQAIRAGREARGNQIVGQKRRAA